MALSSEVQALAGDVAPQESEPLLAGTRISDWLAALSSDAADLAARLRRSVVAVVSRDGGGAGIVWPVGGRVWECGGNPPDARPSALAVGVCEGDDEAERADLLVVTNDHVARSDRVGIQFADGTTAEGLVIGRDPANDLAAIAVDLVHSGTPTRPYTDTPTHLYGGGSAGGWPPPAEIRDARALRPGELIVAVGNPLGMRGAISAGIFSGIVRREGRELIQANLELLPGNSGGPLADARGRVVGVNAMVSAPRLGLAVPSHVVVAFLERVQSGAESPGWPSASP